MKTLWLNDRPVVDVEVSIEKYGVDSYITSAYYDDTGEKLDDNDLDDLQEKYPEVVIDAFTEARGYYSK